MFFSYFLYILIAVAIQALNTDMTDAVNDENTFNSSSLGLKSSSIAQSFLCLIARLSRDINSHDGFMEEAEGLALVLVAAYF